MTHANRPEKIAAIIADIESGASVRKACEAIGVGASTFLRWVEEDGISEQYARAMEKRADAVFEEMFDIADGGSDDVARDRLRVDTRKWCIARMNPKKYSERLDLNHSGAVKVEAVTVEFVRPNK